METERLIIRGAKSDDASDIYKIRNSEYVLKYNAMKALTFEEVMEEVVKDSASSDAFYLELKETESVIGTIYLEQDTLRYGVNSLGLSYYLCEDYSSKGYMTEALRKILQYVFEERGAEVLTVRAFKDNVASIRLIEKLGFTYEGCLRKCVKGYQDIIYDDMVFSMLKEEYYAITKPADDINV